MSRPPHEYPAARATGDLGSRDRERSLVPRRTVLHGPVRVQRRDRQPDSCHHPWHEIALIYLAIGLAMAIVLWPLCWLAVTLYDRAILGCP